MLRNRDEDRKDKGKGRAAKMELLPGKSNAEGRERGRLVEELEGRTGGKCVCSWCMSRNSFVCAKYCNNSQILFSYKSFAKPQHVWLYVCVPSCVCVKLRVFMCVCQCLC